MPLQGNYPDASETINQVIYALNLTFREVEQSYRVWRNERIQGVLQHGKVFYFLFIYFYFCFSFFSRLSEGRND